MTINIQHSKSKALAKARELSKREPIYVIKRNELYHLRTFPYIGGFGIVIGKWEDGKKVRFS